jgi:hypothetical protein
MKAILITENINATTVSGDVDTLHGLLSNVLDDEDYDFRGALRTLEGDQGIQIDNSEIESPLKFTFRLHNKWSLALCDRLKSNVGTWLLYSEISILLHCRCSNRRAVIFMVP